MFEAAISRLKKAVIFNEVEIDKFRGIAEAVEKLVKLKNLEDQDFEDAPDEFKVRGNVWERLHSGSDQPRIGT